MVHMFHEADMFGIIGEDVLIISMLNTIQNKTIMIKVQEQLTDRIDWETVRNNIFKIDNKAFLSHSSRKQPLQMVSSQGGKHAELVARRVTWLSIALYLRTNSTANFVMSRTCTTQFYA